MDYDIRLDDKYGSLTLIDVGAEAAAHEPWFNQTLTTVNDSVVRLGVLHGDFHWHKHDDEDEFFLVLSGQLLIDLRDRSTVTLDPLQGFTVPRGGTGRSSGSERTSSARMPSSSTRNRSRPARSSGVVVSAPRISAAVVRRAASPPSWPKVSLTALK